MFAVFGVTVAAVTTCTAIALRTSVAGVAAAVTAVAGVATKAVALRIVVVAGATSESHNAADTAVI